MAKFYKHDIAAWMDGTEGLNHESYRAYHVICQLIYLNDGPIRSHSEGIAGRCKMSVRAYRKALENLVAEQLISEKNGRLSNSRAEQELEKMETNRENAGKGGKAKANSLKNNDTPLASLPENPALIDEMRGEKRRGESKQDAAAAAILPFEALPEKQKSPEEQVKKELYAECKRLYQNPNSGAAMATKLLKAKGGNVWQAMSALGAAREAGDFKTYLGRIIAGAHDPATGIHPGL